MYVIGNMLGRPICASILSGDYKVFMVLEPHAMRDKFVSELGFDPGTCGLWGHSKRKFIETIAWKERLHNVELNDLMK